jgi:hypothetical protein
MAKKKKSKAGRKPKPAGEHYETTKRYFRMANEPYAKVEKAAKIVSDGNTSEYIRETMTRDAEKVLTAARRKKQD